MSLLERGLGHAEAVGKPDRHLTAFALNINSVAWVTGRAERTWAAESPRSESAGKTHSRLNQSAAFKRRLELRFNRAGSIGESLGIARVR